MGALEHGPCPECKSDRRFTRRRRALSGTYRTVCEACGWEGDMEWPENNSVEPADEDFRREFEGWTIIAVGMTPNCEGGLTFDLARDDERKRIVLGYTELGEWIHAVLVPNELGKWVRPPVAEPAEPKIEYGDDDVPQEPYKPEDA